LSSRTVSASQQPDDLVSAVLNQVTIFGVLFSAQVSTDTKVTLKVFVEIFERSLSSGTGRDEGIGHTAHGRNHHHHRRIPISTHNLNGALKSRCVADGSTAEFEDFDISFQACAEDELGFLFNKQRYDARILLTRKVKKLRSACQLNFRLLKVIR